MAKCYRLDHEMGFPGGSDGKESACNAGDPGSIPGLGRSPGEETAIHSSILASRTSWTEDPGGLHKVHEDLHKVSDRLTNTFTSSDHETEKGLLINVK